MYSATWTPGASTWTPDPRRRQEKHIPRPAAYTPIGDIMKRLPALLLLLLLLPACASRSAAPAAAPAAPSSAKYVALTFDDGPSPRCTPQLLDGLRELGAKATFFVVGCQAVKDPDIVRRIADEGHQVGNHSYDHAALDRLTPAQALADLEKNDALLRELLGKNLGEGSTIAPPLSGAALDMLKIGRGVFVNSNLLAMARGGITIGDHARIAANVQLLSNNHDPYDLDVLTCKPVEIGDYAWIGAGATVLPGVRVGRHAVIGAASVVTKDVPDYAVAVGNPARVIKMLDKEKIED